MSQLYVVKIGTSSVFRNGAFNLSRLDNLGYNLAKLRYEHDTHTVLVTSGAIPFGMAQKDITEKPTNSIELQSCARIGQPLLVAAYTQGLKQGYNTYAVDREIERPRVLLGQYLVTYHNLKDTSEMRNIAMGIVYDASNGVTPTVNYNDGVDPTEVEWDNDTLAARIAKALTADRLVILTDVEGLLDADGNLVSRVTEINEDTYALCDQENSTGGMRTKLDAADLCLKHEPPIPTILGNTEHDLVNLIDGTVPRTLIKN